mgnify:CR=1 FL=1
MRGTIARTLRKVAAQYKLSRKSYRRMKKEYTRTKEVVIEF